MSTTDPGVVSEEAKALEQNGNEFDVVTPWDVASGSSKGIDYDKLIS
jgi:hypothetical protein